ncbi:hypothetical protein ABZT47_23140 [Sphaerisporangium sp. NPDC005289]|uniref:hypothetical protein n=1 Tax=Sphaerisporangium sp. NPDC005289 TaxID=3155247 RepID=UPI0033B233DE
MPRGKSAARPRPIQPASTVGSWWNSAPAIRTQSSQTRVVGLGQGWLCPTVVLLPQ